MTELRSYPVWDVPTRLFHWINALSVIALISVGLVILNDGVLGITNPGKVALKTLHVWIGYVFAANLGWRLIWAFIGNRHARWGSLLPLGQGYFGELRRYVAGLARGEPPSYLGHNPLGRIAVTVLLALMLTMAVTGLLLASTDIFYPPLGAYFAQSIAAPGVDPASIVPYAPELYDKTAYDAMRAMRKPFATVHLYTFYTLLVVIAVHIAAVVITELREGNGLISAMFTGRKVMARKPVDE